jgi:hypothetical protein
MLLLSTVEDVFQLSGRNSVIIVPGIPTRGEQKWKIKIGELLKLEAPDGIIRHTVVGGIEMGGRKDLGFIAILLGPGLTKQEVPVGTKVWINEEATF